MPRGRGRGPVGRCHVGYVRIMALAHGIHPNCNDVGEKEKVGGSVTPCYSLFMRQGRRRRAKYLLPEEHHMFENEVTRENAPFDCPSSHSKLPRRDHEIAPHITSVSVPPKKLNKRNCTQRIDITNVEENHTCIFLNQKMNTDPTYHRIPNEKVVPGM